MDKNRKMKIESKKKPLSEHDDSVSAITAILLYIGDSRARYRVVYARYLCVYAQEAAAATGPRLYDKTNPQAKG